LGSHPVGVRVEGSDSELEEAFARQAGDGYDVVLDYLWGRPTEALVAALTGHDLMAEPTRTRLVQIGEVAGPILRLPAEPVPLSDVEAAWQRRDLGGRGLVLIP
jgi:hypothetical protein